MENTVMTNQTQYPSTLELLLANSTHDVSSDTNQLVSNIFSSISFNHSQPKSDLSYLKQLVNLYGLSILNNSKQENLTTIFRILSKYKPTAAFDLVGAPGTSSIEDDRWIVNLIWSLLFYPMVSLAAASNLLIMWIIATKPMMRSVMNRYLFNLTLSDFLMVTFNASFNFIFMLNDHWPFGQIYCVVNNFITYLTISSSVCTIMLISLDRYYAIVHPLKLRKSRRSLLYSIIAIWSFSILFSLPTLLYSDTMTIYPSVDHHYSTSPPGSVHDENTSLPFWSNKNSNLISRTLCFLRWPDEVTGFSTYEFLYNLAFLVFFYLIPLFTMVVALVLMSRVLWPSERIGEHTTLPQHALIRSKRKVVCMLICVIAVFALCWLPYHSYFISIYLWPSLIQSPAIKHIFLSFYWFAMANSLFNPIILFAMNRRIRNYVLYYLKFTCCLLELHKRLQRSSHRSSMNLMTRKNSTKNSMQFYQKTDSYDGNQRKQLYAGAGLPTARLIYSNKSARLTTHDDPNQCPNGNCVNSKACNPKQIRKCVDWRKEEEMFSMNHSCPPALCSQQNATSSNSTLSQDGFNRCSINSCASCANFDRFYSATKQCAQIKSVRIKPLSRFHFFKTEWTSRKSNSCPDNHINIFVDPLKQRNHFRSKLRSNQKNSASDANSAL